MNQQLTNKMWSVSYWFFVRHFLSPTGSLFRSKIVMKTRGTLLTEEQRQSERCPRAWNVGRRLNRISSCRQSPSYPGITPSPRIIVLSYKLAALIQVEIRIHRGCQVDLDLRANHRRINKKVKGLSVASSSIVRRAAAVPSSNGCEIKVNRLLTSCRCRWRWRWRRCLIAVSNATAD